jgi:hypothetical protein
MSTAPTIPTAPVPPSRQPNNAIWWILGIVGAGIMILVIGALFLVGFIIHRVHVTQSADKVEIETPVGAMKVNTQAAPTGLPVYPDATPMKSEGASAEFSANDKRAGIAVEKYQSSDSRETIAAWYAKRLGPSFRMEKGKGQIAGVQTELESGDVAFVDDHSSMVRVVALKGTSSGTEIVLVRVGKNEPQ